jgi:recombination protein RecR
MLLPEPIQDLINAFSRLPGIGPKTASRLAFYLLHAPDEMSQDLAAALQNLKSGTTFCQVCYNITAAGRQECEICTNPDRDQEVICVVE